MIEYAWSETRNALIPGKYKDGMFVPLNGDEGIPIESVLTSKPNDLNATSSEDFLSENDHRPALNNWTNQSSVSMGALLLLGIALMTVGMFLLKGSLIDNEPSPTINVSRPVAEIPDEMDLSGGLSKLQGVTADVLRKYGNSSGMDCSTDASLIASLQKVQDRAFSSSVTEKSGVMPVSIPGGQAKLVGFYRSFEPGDDGAVERVSDYYLVDKECKSLPLN